MSTQILDCFWKLASVETGTRERATLTLLDALRDSEGKFRTLLPKNEGKTGYDSSEESLRLKFSSDLIYSLKRLIRGLSSSRDGARQGFATALTEVLRMILDIGETISVSLLLRWLDSATEVSKSAKSSGERHAHFGALFGIMALEKSGILSQPACTTTDDLETIIKRLLKISGKKFYFRELVLEITLQIQAILKERGCVAIVEEYIVPILTEETYSPETLLLAIHLEDMFPSLPWKTILSKSGLRSKIIQEKNLEIIAAIMKGTIQAHPRVHIAWNYLIASIPTKITLKMFWDLFVENLLFDSNVSSEKKYLGMQIAEKILPISKPDDIEFLFTPNFIRCLMLALSDNRQDLHRCSQHLIKSLPSICRSRQDLALPLVIQLLKLRKEPHFGGLMKLHFLGSLVAIMDVEGVKRVKGALESIFYQSSEDNLRQVYI